MQRAVQSVARSSVSLTKTSFRRQQVALFSMEGTKFNEREKALEDRYFRELNEEKRRKYADMLHEKELRALVKILPENHGLTTDTLHQILEWKHQPFHL